MEPRRPPQGLGARGRALWRGVLAGYELNAAELEVVRELCAATDELSRLSTAVAHAPATSKGSRGQLVAHPLLAEVRAHREIIRRLTKQLNLPDTGGAGWRRCGRRRLRSRGVRHLNAG